MSRIISSSDDKQKPSIDHSMVESFFDQRAKRIKELGPLVTVIYQDKHPEIAVQRDIAEKGRLLPLLQLKDTQRVLDAGCGTGRWTEIIAQTCKWYHGTDFNKGLIEYDSGHFKNLSNVKFTHASVGEISLSTLGETLPFDLILCFGILIYLNDDEVLQAFNNFSNVVADTSRIMIREPMGIEKRLTIQNHYSEDLEQTYNAVYRTMEELKEMMEDTLFNNGFQIVGEGNMYEDKTLNNRAETRQKWILLERNNVS